MADKDTNAPAAAPKKKPTELENLKAEVAGIKADIVAQQRKIADAEALIAALNKKCEPLDQKIADLSYVSPHETRKRHEAVAVAKRQRKADIAKIASDTIKRLTPAQMRAAARK